MSLTTMSASAIVLNRQVNATTGLHTKVLPKLMPTGLLNYAHAFAYPGPKSAKMMNFGTAPYADVLVSQHSAQKNLPGTLRLVNANAAQEKFEHVEGSSTL